MTPRLVIDDLVPRIEILTDMVIQLSSQLQTSIGKQNQEGHAEISVTTEQSDISSLIESAHSVLQEAKSVVVQSNIGSDDSSSVTTILHHLDLLEKDLEDSITVAQSYQPQEPHKANVLRHAVVDDWIPTLPLASDTSDFDSSSVATRTQMTPTQSTCETPSIGVGYPESAAQDDSDDDSNDDFEYEILQGFLDRGFALYKKSNWADAQPFLSRGLDASKTLRPDKLRHRNIKLDEAQFKMAVCAFHQDKLDDAEVALFQLRTSRAVPNENRETTIRRILATHLFAVLCFDRKQYDEAYKHCRKALSMKRKLIDKEMPWLESTHFNLLSDVARAKKDPVAAEVYHEKALEYSTVASDGDPEPEFAMAKLSNLRIARLSEVDKAAFTKLRVSTKPRAITEYAVPFAQFL
jgi:tetratricopeptide (TPR) repeat protein